MSDTTFIERTLKPPHGLRDDQSGSEEGAGGGRSCRSRGATAREQEPPERRSHVDAYVTLREMWQGAVRRKNLIWLALGISVVVGAFVAYRPAWPPESRQYTVWLASADILVDTADSQVVDSRGPTSSASPTAPACSAT